jgi:hypothetical protein
MRTDIIMEDLGSSSNRGKQEVPPEVAEVKRYLPPRRLAWSLVRSLAWIGLPALARVAVLHPPLVAMKIAVRGIGVMSK